MLYLYRDAELVSIFHTETELYRWLHSTHSYSLNHALTYEGYALFDGDGNEVRA